MTWVASNILPGISLYFTYHSTAATANHLQVRSKEGSATCHAIETALVPISNLYGFQQTIVE